MKKFFVLLALCAASCAFIYAQDDSSPTDAQEVKTDEVKKPFQWPEWMSTKDVELSKPMRKERYVEFGTDWALETPSFDELGSIVEKLGGGIEGIFGDSGNIDIGIFAKPLTVKVNIGSIVAIDFFTGLDVNVQMAMEGDLLKAIDELSNINENTNFNGINGNIKTGVSMFAEIGAGAGKYFLGRKLYVRAAPSVYFPVIYMKEGELNLNGEGSGMDSELKYNADMEIFSSFSMDNDFSPSDIFGSAGLDLTLEGRYAVWEILEAGAAFIHIPIAPAKAKYKSTLYAKEQVANITDHEIDKITLESSKPAGEKFVMRPTRFDFFAVYKPFKTMFVYVKPNLGFSVNTIMGASFNGGLEAGVNLKAILSATLGSHYTEGTWEHAIKLAMDLRVVELDLLAGLTGPEFVTDGFILGVLLKFGF